MKIMVLNESVQWMLYTKAYAKNTLTRGRRCWGERSLYRKVTLRIDRKAGLTFYNFIIYYSNERNTNTIIDVASTLTRSLVSKFRIEDLDNIKWKLGYLAVSVISQDPASRHRATSVAGRWRTTIKAGVCGVSFNIPVRPAVYRHSSRLNLSVESQGHL